MQSDPKLVAKQIFTNIVKSGSDITYEEVVSIFTMYAKLYNELHQRIDIHHFVQEAMKELEHLWKRR